MPAGRRLDRPALVSAHRSARSGRLLLARHLPAPGLPGIRRLLRHRRRKRPEPALGTATAMITLAHETIHTIGISSEVKAECYGMQLITRTSVLLGTTRAYGQRLAEIFLKRYYRPDVEPQGYWSVKCRNG